LPRKSSFTASATATFAAIASGLDSICQASVGPTVFGINWMVTSITTTTTSTGTEFNRSSELIVYQDAITPSAQMFGTFNADNDVATGEFYIPTLSKLVFVWQHGDVGTVATVIIRGNVESDR
jgi:hypothetical protein